MQITRPVLAALLVFVSIVSVAQPKEFEGTIVYKTDVRSKEPNTSDRVWKNLMGLSDSMVVKIKNGNYRQTTAKADFYNIPQDQKTYYVFKGIDTLYYTDYNSDTTKVLDVIKPTEKKMIGGYECKTIKIKTAGITTTYNYAPALYMNPEYDKNNSIGQYNIYTRETSSIYLGYELDSKVYTFTQTLQRMQAEPVDASTFKLPELPQKGFSLASLVKPPEFRGSAGWIKYLQSNVDANLGAKYVKIPKGQKTGTETVYVAFMINDKGMVAGARVVNPDEVHSKLADEALRVVNASPAWKPATIFGEKTIYWMQQPITFQASEK